MAFSFSGTVALLQLPSFNGEKSVKGRPWHAITQLPPFSSSYQSTLTNIRIRTSIRIRQFCCTTPSPSTHTARMIAIRKREMRKEKNNKQTRRTSNSLLSYSYPRVNEGALLNECCCTLGNNWHAIDRLALMIEPETYNTFLRVNIQTTVLFFLVLLIKYARDKYKLLTAVCSSSSTMPFYSCALELAVWLCSLFVLWTLKEQKETRRTLHGLFRSRVGCS